MNEDELADLLADENTWAEPRPDGAEALLAAMAAVSDRGQSGGPDRPGEPSEPGGPGGSGGAADPGGPADRRSRGRRPGRWLSMVAAAAVVTLLAGVAAVVVLRDDRDDRRPEWAESGGEEMALVGTALASDASAVATVQDPGGGFLIELDVRGLPPAEPGTYYQGWVAGDEGSVSVGTFHMRDGDGQVDLWSGVDLARYPTLNITVQQEDGGPASSGEIVLTGTLAR